MTQPIQDSGLSGDDADEDEDEENLDEEAEEAFGADEMIVDNALSKDLNGMSRITGSKCATLITL